MDKRETESDQRLGHQRGKQQLTLLSNAVWVDAGRAVTVTQERHTDHKTIYSGNGAATHILSELPKSPGGRVPRRKTAADHT